MKPTKTVAAPVPETQPDWPRLLDYEQRRLAMLWKAFQQAEARIASLEALLAQTRSPAFINLLTPVTSGEPVGVAPPSEELLSHIARLESELAQAHARGDLLSEELSAARETHAESSVHQVEQNAQLAQAHARLGESEKDVQELRLVIEDLRTVLNDALRRTEALSVELDDSRARLAEADSRAAAFGEQLQESQDRVREIEGDLDRFRALLSEADAHLAQSRAAEAAALSRAENAESDAHAWRERALLAESRLATAQVTIVALEDELTPKPVPPYPAEAYFVNKIVEITPEQAATLRTYGVNFTDEILYANLPRLSAATGIPLTTLHRWRDISEMIAVDGIGPKWAVRLVDAGVTTIRMLASLTPEQLTEMLHRSYETQQLQPRQQKLLQRTLPGRSVKLIKAARRDAGVLGWAEAHAEGVASLQQE